MAGLADFYAGLKAMLENDVGLAAWADEHFGRGITVIGGINVGTGREGESPLALVELDTTEVAEVILQGARSRVVSPMLVRITWAEEDPDQMFAQRLALPDLLTNAIARDRKLGERVAICRLTDWDWEETEGTTAMLVARVRGQYDLVAF